MVGSQRLPGVADAGQAVHIGFAHIYSDRTVAHLSNDPQLTVSVADIFQRRGIIVRGTARILYQGTAAFEKAAKSFVYRRGALPRGVQAFVVAEVAEWEPTYSPAHDDGSDVDAVEARWREFYDRQARSTRNQPPDTQRTPCDAEPATGNRI